ncbi:MAG TPA: hypothetical protein VIH36_04115 [Casimicrobiaceae bacterium]
MKQRTELDLVSQLARGGAHAPPSVDVLRTELRSDSGIEVPLPPPASKMAYIVVKWKYSIRFAQLDAFHGLLAEVDELLHADVKDLKIGAAYMGTYAELPQCTLHQTFWNYKTPAAIDEFKSALASMPKSQLYKNLAKLVSYIDDPAVGMHRLVRASALARQVSESRRSDPILDMFAANKR